MPEFIYHIVIFAVATLAILRGFRLRLSRQIPSLIGFTFGGICSHIFMDPATTIAIELFHIPTGGLRGLYLASNIAGAVVFAIAYYAFKICTYLIGLLMRNHPGDLLDNIAGSFFCMLKYLMLLSVIYNMILGIGMSPKSTLFKYADQDDANVVREVMLISPGILGSESITDLSHRIQLHEASKIS